MKGEKKGTSAGRREQEWGKLAKVLRGMAHVWKDWQLAAACGMRRRGGGKEEQRGGREIVETDFLRHFCT